MITLERLKQVTKYNHSTGEFIRRKTLMSMGSTRKDGYREIRIDYKSYLVHRLAWFYFYEQWPEGVIDHIDRNPSNNRIGNLRDVSHSVNHINSGNFAHNTSGVRGVDLHKQTGKWRARVAEIHLGLFVNKEDAEKAVRDFSIKHYQLPVQEQANG